MQATETSRSLVKAPPSVFALRQSCRPTPGLADPAHVRRQIANLVGRQQATGGELQTHRATEKSGTTRPDCMTRCQTTSSGKYT